MVKERFSPDIFGEIKNYVYRLVDPRNGQTFYVGVGKENRVFDHVEYDLDLKDGKDAQSEKYSTIREIKNSGFEVQHVIHRHGMDSNAARQVEAALIDAYPGLTNIQRGVGSAVFGCKHSKEIMSYYSSERAAGGKFKLICVNVNRSGTERNGVYELARYAWRANIRRAKRADYVLAVRNGIIAGIFKPDRWLEATKSNFPIPEDMPGRIGFEGAPAQNDVWNNFVDKRVPEEFKYKKGSSNPFRYNYD